MADINICPKCGSTDLKGSRFSKHPSFVFSCECGYIGICPIIDDADINHFREELKNITTNAVKDISD